MAFYETTLHLERDGNEVTVYIRGNVTPYVRGRYSGPPEDCYPDEGGDVEDVEAWVESDTGDVPDFKLTPEEQVLAVEALPNVAAEDDSGPEYESDED